MQCSGATNSLKVTNVFLLYYVQPFLHSSAPECCPMVGLLGYPLSVLCHSTIHFHLVVPKCVSVNSLEVSKRRL